MSLIADRMCRTCMYSETNARNRAVKAKERQMVTLSTVRKDIKDDTKLIDILRAAAPQLRIELNDRLPKIICLQCIEKVKEIHKFQQNCLKVEQQLHKLLEVDKADGHSPCDKFDSNTEGDGENLINSEVDDVFVDESSFQTDEFVDEDNAKDSLEAISDMDDFIESCSDISIDFVLDDDSESDYDLSKNGTAKKTSNTIKQESQLLFPCERCKRTLKSELSLKKHMEMHNKKDAEEPKYTCNICDKAFTQAYMLREHLRSHSGERPFLCSECGKGFTTSSGLKQHVLRHQSDRQFACPDCPKTFPTRTDLASHYDVHKARPKIHICDVCGRGFPKAFILKKHKMSHTNVRPFPCEFCEKRFLTNEKLQRHTRIHTGEKPYKCKYCERAYCQSNELTKHLRSHLGDNVYQCRLCPQRYPTAKMVKEHFKTHKHDDEQTREQNLADLNAMEVKGIFCR